MGWWWNTFVEKSWIVLCTLPCEKTSWGQLKNHSALSPWELAWSFLLHLIWLHFCSRAAARWSAAFPNGCFPRTSLKGALAPHANKYSRQKQIFTKSGCINQLIILRKGIIHISHLFYRVKTCFCVGLIAILCKTNIKCLLSKHQAKSIKRGRAIKMPFNCTFLLVSMRR